MAELSRLSLFALGAFLGAACIGGLYVWDRLAPLPAVRAPGTGIARPAPLPAPGPAAAPSLAPVPALPESVAPAPETAAGHPILTPTQLPPESTPGAMPPTGAPAPDLLIPVAGVPAAALMDTFTQARGSDRVHDAIDIMAPRGTPVLAVADGRIAKLFTSAAGGLTVYQFDATETWAYYYAHLDAYAPGLAEGALVKRGDAIGTVGSTGNANPEGPHLHFAVFELWPERKWWQGTPINPYPLLISAPSH